MKGWSWGPEMVMKNGDLIGFNGDLMMI